MIRPASGADLADVARVHATTWRTAYTGIVPDSYLGGMSPEVSLARRRERYPDYPVLPQGEELVAEQDGVIVGFASLGRVRDVGKPAEVGEVWALYVLPEHQECGLGSALLAAGVARLRTLGFSSIVLWVLTGNVSARAFYERRGFALDGGTKNWEGEGWSLPQVRYRLAAGGFQA
ncbi:MAG: GNAT family N-acetyltransferase [Geodermatophilaceae bacterium]